MMNSYLINDLEIGLISHRPGQNEHMQVQVLNTKIKKKKSSNHWKQKELSIKVRSNKVGIDYTR